MPSIEEWNRQADQLNWMAQHGMGGLAPLINELPQWARGRVGAVPGGVGAIPGVGGAGTLQGAAPLPGTYNSASGGIPGTTGTGASLANLLQSISGQVGNLAPIISSITGAENQALRDQYPAEYFSALGTTLGNVGRRAQGDISDLVPQMQQGAAEFGIGAGVSGSPAANSKLLRDLGLTAYGVQREALQDLGRVQDAIPKVAPYSPNRLIPDIGQQLNLQAIADMLRAAPVPEAAFQRSLALANQGLNRGLGAGIGPVWGGAGGPAVAAGNRGPALTMPQAGGMPPNVATTPGWGQAWNNQGGFAQAGQVPDWAGQPNVAPATPAWGQFQPMDELFAGGNSPLNVGPAWNGGGLFDPIFDESMDWFDDEFFE